MEISVIIPTYKPQDYIWDCLKSLCEQTFPKQNYEVIIVLNGCKIPYEQQLNTFFDNHPEVNWSYIQTDQGGVSNARNIALDIARGDYICFIDDDDYISPSYLKDLYSKADRNTVSISNSFAFVDQEPTKIVSYNLATAFEKYRKKGKMKASKVRFFFRGPWMKLISREIIGERRFNPSFSNGEDSLFMFLISNKIKFVEFTSINAIYYRRYRENSAVTRSYRKSSFIINEWNLLVEFFKIYFRHPCEYSILRFSISCMGLLKAIIKAIIK